jgi:hypothetical protein
MGNPIKNNVLNDLDTQEWVRRLHSIQEYEWHIPPELKEHLKLGVLTPPPLAADIIRFFTQPMAEIIDPFAGEGGILVGAALAGRLAAGCDLYADNRKTAAKIGAHYGFPAGKGWWGMQTADAVDWLQHLLKRGMAETQDLLFTDPPWGIDHGRTLDKGGSVPFNMVKVKLGGKDKPDIGTFKEWNYFYQYIGQVAHYAEQLLKPGAYALWWFGDRHRGGKYRVVGAEAQAYIEEASGLRLKGVQHYIQRPLNVRRQVFGWGKAFVPLVDHFSLYIYRKEPRQL